jgi:uncharacterized membrane protein
MFFACEAAWRWHNKAKMKTRSLTHLVYLITIAIKGTDGVIETLLGLLIAITGPDRLYSLILHFTTPELTENPANRTAAAIQHGAAGLAHASARFMIFYLLVHGILKSGIAVNLLAGKRWIFAPACVILTGFILYMGYHATQHFSWWLLGFALFDLFTVALVINEWTNQKHR